MPPTSNNWIGGLERIMKTPSESYFKENEPTTSTNLEKDLLRNRVPDCDIRERIRNWLPGQFSFLPEKTRSNTDTKASREFEMTT